MGQAVQKRTWRVYILGTELRKAILRSANELLIATHEQRSDGVPFLAQKVSAQPGTNPPSVYEPLHSAALLFP